MHKNGDKDRLVRRLRDYGLTEKAEDLADYLMQNNIIVPPCKTGQEVFGIFDNDDEDKKEIYRGKVRSFSLDINGLLWANVIYDNGLTYWHTINDFKETLFLEKEEAKKIIERSVNNE